MLLQERRIVYSFYLPFCVIVFSLTLLLPCICKLNADAKILKIILALLWSGHNLKYCFLIGVLTDFHKLSKSHEMTLFQSDVLRMCSIFFEFGSQVKSESCRHTDLETRPVITQLDHFEKVYSPNICINFVLTFFFCFVTTKCQKCINYQIRLVQC